MLLQLSGPETWVMSMFAPDPVVLSAPPLWLNASVTTTLPVLLTVPAVWA
jgi:hypothetical protein